MQWTVSQIGSREHYAVPRALENAGHLRQFFTEAWCRWGRGVLARGPGATRALASRWHAGIPSSKVISYTPSTMAGEISRKLTRRGQNADEMFNDFITIGKSFAQRVTQRLRKQELHSDRDAFFGYDTGCLETLEYLNERKILSVVDQIDPARVEEQMVLEEARKWPNWQAMPGRIPEVYWSRLAAEWSAASMVLVNSTWSKDALIRQGVDAGKIIVVPLAYEPPANVAPREPARDGPLTVLWLGSVILRKGIQYLIEAAKLLRDAPVRFVVAGPVGITADAVASAPPNVSFIGRVTSDRAPDVYRSADVFVLPTISDGFAITQIEAMAYGLPVITTPNCGEVVSNGVDGLIVGAGDGAALGAAINILAEDRVMLAGMSRAALIKSKQFSLAAYAQRLEAAAQDFARG